MLRAACTLARCARQSIQPPVMSPSRGLQTAVSSMQITFLGTASAQPSSTRNHSALALRLDGDVWLFDCGEATQGQIQKSQVKMGRIKKIFITHTHGDHIFGLAPLMAGCMNGNGAMVDGNDTRGQRPSSEPLEIYGPFGTRAYIRSNLVYTRTKLDGKYVVHELRLPTDPPSDNFSGYQAVRRHWNELPTGKNFRLKRHRRLSEDGSGSEAEDETHGMWRAIYKDNLITVSAAPILHSIPCVGYVIQESPVPEKMDPSKYVPEIKRTGARMNLLARIQRGEDVTLPDGTVLRGLEKRPGRKLAILGDTYDPSPIADLAMDADLLIHEATNAHLPGLDPATKDDDTYETVEARTKSRGHSTPQMAGKFATRIRARRLILNHFSARYKGNDDVDKEAAKVMNGIKQLAQQEYEGDITTARDLMSVELDSIHKTTST